MKTAKTIDSGLERSDTISEAISGEGRAARAAGNRSKTVKAAKTIDSGLERSDTNK